jgi:hypothetical protein
MNTVKKYADAGRKGNGKASFQMYLSPVEIENNFMLIKSCDSSICLIRLFALNSIVSDSISMCSKIEEWTSDLISKSTLISGTSNKERLNFFNTSQKRIDSLISKINS